MVLNTEQEYTEIISKCENLFIDKMEDYGSAWRILRLTSLTDQIYIKAQRIRSIQVKGVQRVKDNIEGEFIGIINYCVMAIIQLENGIATKPDLDTTQAIQLYEGVVSDTIELMLKKNHDYGEAWRNMRISSLTDLIIQKLLRVKQIEDNDGLTQVSEGVKANYQDIFNYAVFSLILTTNTN